MIVIPGINCKDFSCVRNRLERIESLSMGPQRWAHLDVGMPPVTLKPTWNSPKELQELTLWNKTDSIELEVHLMIPNPHERIEEWLSIQSIRRAIVHVEHINSTTFKTILDACMKADAECMLAINPETPVETLLSYLDQIESVQFLAVRPGPSGQKFQESVLQKILSFKEEYPELSVEVDGGVIPQVAKKLKRAGVDIVVSTSYLFNDDERIQERYNEFMNL